MTTQERKKLAKAARELASAFAEGRGPELQPGDWCGCAAGELFKRAGIPNEPTTGTDYRMPSAILDIDFLDTILTDATHEQYGYGDVPGRRMPGAVVFALLWAADELESAR